MAFTRNTLVAGALGALATSAAAAILGKKQRSDGFEPINAVSHILFGDEAFESSGFDPKHTLSGLALNGAAVVSWAAVQEWALSRRDEDADWTTALLAGAGVSALAYVVDYHVVPKRLTPGFEEKLDRVGMAAMYAVLAGSLAAGALLRKPKRSG